MSGRSIFIGRSLLATMAVLVLLLFLVQGAVRYVTGGDNNVLASDRSSCQIVKCIGGDYSHACYDCDGLKVVLK